MSKADNVELLKKTISAQKGAVVAEFKGLTVAEITSLRRKLREVNAEFRVVKNTLMRLAATDTEFSRLDDYFKGPTAVAFTYGDPVALAKTMKTFATASPKITLKAGFLDGKALTAPEVEALADVPSREILLSRMVGSLASPLTRLVQVLSGPQRKLVYALDSIRTQKSA
ncbi:MAG TPA: 50S ribosomal protein L10 [Candidatus Deferrimicrobiaceae bacterium]|jgi:large subunit ribosomal protein L10